MFGFLFLAPYARRTRYEEAFLPKGKKRPRSLRSLGVASLWSTTWYLLPHQYPALKFIYFEVFVFSSAILIAHFMLPFSRLRIKRASRLPSCLRREQTPSTLSPNRRINFSTRKESFAGFRPKTNIFISILNYKSIHKWYDPLYRSMSRAMFRRLWLSIALHLYHAAASMNESIERSTPSVLTTLGITLQVRKIPQKIWVRVQARDVRGPKATTTARTLFWFILKYAYIGHVGGKPLLYRSHGLFPCISITCTMDGGNVFNSSD